METLLNTQKVYTILELNTSVRGVIRQNFPEYVWVCGEIQDIKIRPNKKHIYFNFVQKHPENNEIVAQIGGVIFEDARKLIYERIEESENAFQLKDDIEVKFLCRVDLFPKWGSYRIIVVDIDPIYTLGKIARQRLEIIERLKCKGLLDKNKALPFPVLPLKVGLITSYNSAAYWDFVNELKMSGYGFVVLLYDCYMQGKYVEENVLEALRFFNKFSSSELDCVVISRGGGSTADLSYFDNEKIAVEIAGMKFPVLCALGHQINTTISDMVANISLKTPTKAADYLIEKINFFLEKLDSYERDIFTLTEDIIDESKKNLHTTAIKLNAFVSDFFRHHREHTISKKFDLDYLVKNIFDREKQKNYESASALKENTENILKKEKERIKFIEEKLNILDPKNILKRGYSITFLKNKNGRIILKDTFSLRQGDLIENVLFKGRLQSLVSKIFKD